MTADVERVARVLCAASGDVWRSGDGLTAAAKSAGIDPEKSNNHWLHKARAAMAVTREIDAEAIKGDYMLTFPMRVYLADWLQERANEVKGQTDGE